MRKRVLTNLYSVRVALKIGTPLSSYVFGQGTDYIRSISSKTHTTNARVETALTRTVVRKGQLLFVA